MTSTTDSQGSSTILCTLCRHLGLGHDGDHLVPSPDAEQPHRGIGSVLVSDPASEAQQALEATPTAELLTKAYALTHQIHESEVRERYSADVQRTRDLRAMRDLITAEVLRRTGGA